MVQCIFVWTTTSCGFYKVQAITSWPIQTNQKQVQQFLGLYNYYCRFIPDFATMAKPLHQCNSTTQLSVRACVQKCV